MLATTVAPVSSSPGRTFADQYSMPGPCSPTAFIMPWRVGWTLGAGFPGHSYGASDLVTIAPIDDRSKNGESSVP